MKLAALLDLQVDEAADVFGFFFFFLEMARDAFLRIALSNAQQKTSLQSDLVAFWVSKSMFLYLLECHTWCKSWPASWEFTIMQETMKNSDSCAHEADLSPWFKRKLHDPEA